MTSLDGRVIIITGAGRGIGREHVLYLAREGARLVVNDRGGANDGTGDDATPAEEVAAEARALGAQAVANTDDVTDWAGAKQLIDQAVEVFGDLDVLINNAGILRDRYLANMTEEEFDSVVSVHLKGHFAPTRHAATYWRDEHKAGRVAPRNIVHTSSTSGLFANPGQTNYGAAKSGIATMSQIAAKELGRYGIVSNCIAPGARTRLTLATPGLEDIMTAPESGFDNWNPANVAPLAAYLSVPDCPFSGETFYIKGGVIKRVKSWEMADRIEKTGTWTVAELHEAMEPMAAYPPVVADMD